MGIADVSIKSTTCFRVWVIAVCWGVGLVSVIVGVCRLLRLWTLSRVGCFSLGLW